MMLGIMGMNAQETFADGGQSIKELESVGSETPSLKGKLVIGKVFYAGSTRLNGATPKNYMRHLFIELYNNSAEAIDVAGTYIAMANTDNGNAAWTATAMATEHPDSAVVKQIFQIPADAPVLLEAGKSLVITNCAIDHSEIAEGKVDLSDADFEQKTTNAGFSDHSESVPALTLVKSYGTIDFINFLNPGPDGIVLLPANTDIEGCPATYGKGKTTGNLYTIVPMNNAIDCVDIVMQKTPSADDKRFADAYDAGFTCTADPGIYNCQSVARKVASVEEDGRVILADTDNSTNDFESFNNIQPRIYNIPVAFDVEASTVAELIAVENGKVVKLNLNGIHVNAYNPLFWLAYIEDETGVAELNLKNTGITFESGDQLSGYIYGVKEVKELDFMGTYPNMMEHLLSPIDGTNDYNLSAAAGTATPTEATIVEAEQEGNHGKLIKLANLTVSKTGRFWYGYQGEDKIQLNDELGVMGEEYEWPAAIESLTGVVTYNGVRWQIAPITAESVTTGISSIAADSNKPAAIFNLQGQRLNNVQKGLYIVNGKKIVVK